MTDPSSSDNTQTPAGLRPKLQAHSSPSIFLTVAEPSADQHAARLITEMKKLIPNAQLHAIGGEKMRAAGATIHHESVRRAAMGWRAALRAREVANWLKWTEQYYREHKPALHICCDSWSMNWRFARLARSHGVPVLYYIAPQTWASREGRIHKIRRYVNKLACILPFEEQYFRQHRIDATYVGHPLFDELHGIESLSKAPGTCSMGTSMIQSKSFPTIGILPGSRLGIVAHNFPHQLDVARRILRTFPNAKFLVPTTDITHAKAAELSRGFPNLTQALNGFDQIVPQCDFCLSVSGTAALHIAAYNVPFVIVYRVNPLHWHFAGRWIVKTRTYSLVNIFSGQSQHIVPEFIPWYGSNQPVTDKIIDYLNHPEKMAEQKRALRQVLLPLARPGAARNVAQMAFEMCSSSTIQD